MKQWQNRQKKIAFLAAGILSGAAIVFTGCGDGNTQEEHVVGTLEAQPILSSLEVEIVNMETKYRKGELTREEYLTLAKDYGEIGRVREERDLLEQSYRLYDDTEAFELLQTLTVNLVEEEPQIRQTAETLTENLTQDDTVGEAIQALTGEEWFDTLMPKLREGQRSYYLDGDGELYFQVGYGADGAKVTKVWYTAGGRSIFLQNTENTLKIVICTGDAIVSYYLDAGTGSITREQGTMKNDVLTGEYTCDISSGENGVDLSSLWNSRGELEYTTYQGKFDDEGKTLLEQPGEAELKKLLEGSGYQKAVLYAYDASTGRCLWQRLDSDAAVESYSFGGDMLGLQSVPEYSAYEAQPMAEQNAEETSGASGEVADNIARVRVFDGEIQWFDGKYWVSAGKAADLIQEDPFLAYEERENASGTQVASAQSAEGAQPGESGENGSSAGEIKAAAGNKNTGTVTLASNKPAADNKNKTGTTSTTKPSATSKPSETNKPSSTTNTAGSSSGSGSSSGGSTNSGGNSSSGGSSSSGGGSSSGGSTNSGGNSSSGGGSGSDSGSSSGGSSGSDSGSSSGGSGSDSGSSSGGSSSDSGSSSGGGSGSDSGGSSGGDVDVDWSPDIM
ncbi:hypothetical protein [Simiaoa sp.]|uniref:hypothetical protein n=1 Tax=Simiaoa sp. TaxID=2944202 RepID=UPI003F7E2395